MYFLNYSKEVSDTTSSTIESTNGCYKRITEIPTNAAINLSTTNRVKYNKSHGVNPDTALLIPCYRTIVFVKIEPINHAHAVKMPTFEKWTSSLPVKIQTLHVDSNSHITNVKLKIT